jgi:hypothetical protein
MFGHLVGLILVGLGINTSMFGSNANVKGVETTATREALPKDRKNTFRLDPKNFELHSTVTSSSAAGTGKPRLDTRAFGLGVLQMREDFADQIAASREAFKKEIEHQQVTLQNQIAHLKDENKKRIVAKVTTNCQDISLKRTDRMTEMLTKLSTILANVSNHAASASAAGRDTAGVESTITIAQSAIADAQSAVASQAGILCNITVTGDATVKSEVGSAIKAFQNQLKSVYSSVVAAKKAVGDAIRALSDVTGERL